MSKSVVSIVKNPSIPDAKRIDEMAKEAMNLLGGMETFIKAGDVVVIKGNFFAPYPPPVSVDRRTASSIIRMCFEAGASRVILCEAVSIGTKLGRGTSTSYVMEELGVADAAREEGAEILCLEDDERITVKVPNAKSIDYVEYPKTIYDSDVLINLPCMKTHGMTLISIGIKNFQGLLIDYQKYYAHRDDLEQKLVDVFKIRKPDLTFIDCLTAMEGNGSGERGTPRIMNMFIASCDVVAADAVASACMGIDDVMDVTSTRIAHYDGIGCGDLSQINIAGAQVKDVMEKFKYPDKFTGPINKRLLAAYKNVDVRIGGACRQCWGLGGDIAKKLSAYNNVNFTMIIGADPKVACSDQLDLDNVIVFGDCACSATGTIKDIRNRMLLENKGVLAFGCPPYRPASMKIEEYLIRRGLTNKENIEKNKMEYVKKTYEYYTKIDPTWIPKSKQAKIQHTT